MLKWLWQGLAGLASIAALWFGFDTARTKQRLERDQAEREQAIRKMVEQAHRDLIETRKRHAAQAPINPNKRKDFE